MSSPDRPPLNGPTAIFGVALLAFVAFVVFLACNGVTGVLR